MIYVPERPPKTLYLTERYTTSYIPAYLKCGYSDMIRGTNGLLQGKSKARL
jgi:hypothetical protein